MKNEKSTPYIPPEVEIIMFECDDIMTASVLGDDENVDDDW